jgi:putative endonuclease
MLRCSDGSLYTGIATDLSQRLKVHNAGKGSAYVRSRLPAKLLAFTPSPNRSAASALEYRIKHLDRREKLDLARAWEKQAAASHTGKTRKAPVRRVGPGLPAPAKP